MGNYLLIKANDELWEKLSPLLRGKCFRVPYKWSYGMFLSRTDWQKLIKRGLVGNRLYVQKTKIISYKTILEPQTNNEKS
ncbi:hypothetical protein KAW65_06080 [candidate division WOR-3 bacterium]|nr:hypothetical protein [candidate division WOR-3 bacterium]